MTSASPVYTAAVPSSPPYVLFYDHIPGPSNPVSLACFSHWFPSPFRDIDRYPTVPHFPTAEHYMMYVKAVTFGDHEAASAIAAAPTPGEAKALGRTVRGFSRMIWNTVADEAVERGNYLKFSSHDTLWYHLQKTQGVTLVEASPTDRIWGIGFGVDDAKGKEAFWGDNRMGLALTRARDKLLAERRDTI